MSNYFSSTFKSQQRGNEEASKNFDVVGCRLDEGKLNTLNASFTEDDVKGALFQMKALKAPDSDGLLPLFYQNY